METKGLLQSKTILSGLGSAGLNMALIVGLITDYLPQMQVWLMSIIPPPFEDLVQPAVAILLFGLTYFFGSGVVTGRKRAHKSIKGMWKG